MAANCRLVIPLLFGRVGRFDEVVFTGSPPFMLYFASALKRFRGIRLTYRITDFYPEVVAATMRRKSWVLSMVGRLTWALRRRVDRFEVLGEDQRRILQAGGIDADRIQLVRDRSPVIFSERLIRRAPPAALGSRYCLLYSGNYGVAHEVETVVEGLTQHHLHGSDRLGLWINGSGVNSVAVAEALQSAEVPVVLTPPAPLTELAALLLSADAHLITLRTEFTGLVLPSKVYGCLGLGRPIIFVGPANSDVHLLCSEADGIWYRRVEPKDADGFYAALEQLADFIQAERRLIVPEGHVTGSEMKTSASQHPVMAKS